MDGSFRNVVLLSVVLTTAVCAQLSPRVEPDRWLLSFVDVERTGLQPGYHEIVNVGIVLSDLDGNEIARTLVYILPKHPERASVEALAINGYNRGLWDSLHALNIPAAVDTIVAFYRRHAQNRHVLMVAYNAQFDAAFMDHLFREVGRDIREVHHYYVMDIPSMAWVLGIRDLDPDDVAGKFKIRGTSKVAIEHTGLGCADLNFRLYRELLKRAKK